MTAAGMPLLIWSFSRIVNQSTATETLVRRLEHDARRVVVRLLRLQGRVPAVQHRELRGAVVGAAGGRTAQRVIQAREA